MAADFRPARSTATAWRTYAPAASGRPRTRPLNRSRLSPRRPRALKRPPMDGARFPDALGAKRSLSGFGAKSSGAPPPRTTSNRTSAARDRRKRSPVPARPRCTIAGPRLAGVKVAGVSSKPVSSGGVLFGGFGAGTGFGWTGAGCSEQTAPAAPLRRDLDVVDPDPLVLSDSVRREHAHLNQWLPVGRRRQVHAHRETRVACAGPARRVGHVAARHPGERPRRAHAVLQRHGLDGVVGRGIDVAQQHAHAHTNSPARVEGQDQMRCARRGGSLDRHHRVGQLELRHPGGQPDGARVGEIRGHVHRRAGAVRAHAAGITPGLAGQAVAAVSDDAGHARPVVVRPDQAGVTPPLGERQGGRSRPGLRGKGHQKQAGKPRRECSCHAGLSAAAPRFAPRYRDEP